jgi:hypothetical protein
MALDPDGLATLDFKTNSTTTLGCLSFDLDDVTEMEEYAVDDDTAKRRFPGLDDATGAKATFAEDDGDAGQDKIRAAKAAHTAYEYVVVKGLRTFTFTAYISKISRPEPVGKMQKMNVEFAISGGVAET